jgi:hypothetical protein
MVVGRCFHIGRIKGEKEGELILYLQGSAERENFGRKQGECGNDYKRSQQALFHMEYKLAAA